MVDAAKKTVEELVESLSGCPQRGTFWRHYKGGRYFILASAILKSTQEPMVIYQARRELTSLAFTCPLKEWHEEVEREGEKVPRFRLEVLP